MMIVREAERLVRSLRDAGGKRISVKIAVVAGLLAANSGAAFAATCTPTPSVAPSSTVQESFWGLHLSAVNHLPWPTITFSSVRSLWTYTGVSWSEINTRNGYYNWSSLDAFVNTVSNRGKSILYTFHNPPSWAGRPSASNLGPWVNYVRAIVSRYCDKIKYWELWNEPNSSNSWSGSTADMVAMAKAAYPIIKAAGGIMVGPGPQGRYAYKWLDDFFSKGGGNYIDVVAIHGYTFTGPETIVPFIESVRKSMATYGQAHKAIWDTEHSWWDGTAAYGDTEMNRSKFLSRHVILEASLGVSRAYWYMWDNLDLGGGLFDRYTKQIRMPGIVLQRVHDWLTGRQVRCTLNGLVYSCTAGSNRAIYWNIRGWGSTVTVDPKFTKWQDIYGSSGKISSNHQVSFGGLPVMVE